MQFSIAFAFAGVLLLAPGTPCPQDPASNPPGKVDARLQQLTWLCGTWTIRHGDVTTEEHWRPLHGTTILGSSHTFDAKQTKFFEHLRITALRDAIAYIAMPGGKAPTVFLLSKLEDGVVEFENPKHDHPQRIRYERTEQGITATVSLLDSSRREQFVFARQ